MALLMAYLYICLIPITKMNEGEKRSESKLLKVGGVVMRPIL